MWGVWDRKGELDFGKGIIRNWNDILQSAVGSTFIGYEGEILINEVDNVIVAIERKDYASANLGLDLETEYEDVLEALNNPKVEEIEEE